MAGKKREGLAGIKDTKGGQRRDDRQAIGKSTFEPITIDAKNAQTVIYMLQSPEENVVLRAVASLEGYGRKTEENLRLLSSLGIFEFLFPLVHNSDQIIKRFALKLIGMLSSLEEFREQILKVDNVLNAFVDILNKESDVVMHEYSSLTLAELSKKCQVASELLKVDNCIETLFSRITSPDPDVEKNCLDIMHYLLNDVNGIEVFVQSSAFAFKLLLDLIPSCYPVIQALAIEVLKQLTSWCRDTRVLFLFRDASGIETILEVIEKEEWSDLHSSALDLLINIVDHPDLCDYLLQSDCLLRLVRILDTEECKIYVEKMLGVFARMSQTRRGRLALYTTEIGKRFSFFLSENSDGIQEHCCLGIANLAEYLPCLDHIFEENPTSQLLDILVDPEKNFTLRNMAAYALNILIVQDKRASKALIEDKKYEKLFSMLTEKANVPIELLKNTVHIFIGISQRGEDRIKVISEDFLASIMSFLNNGEALQMKDVSVQVDALECLSGYLVEWEARSIFDVLDGAGKLIDCLHSKYASVREWAGHLVVQASQSYDFVKSFIKKDGLHWLLIERNTRYSMPSWQSAVEAIFATHLPAKFSYLGRLDFQDITQDGFYLSSSSRGKFILLDEFLDAKISPIYPLYVANFNVTSSSSSSGSDAASEKSSRSNPKPQQSNTKSEEQNYQKYMKGADRNSMENYSWNGSLNTYSSVDYADPVKLENYSSDYFGKVISDPYLNEYLENLRKKIAKEEKSFGDTGWLCIHPKLVRERARIIAQFVADEMSGPEPNPACSRLYKEMHINELKFQLATNILPLGFIKMGDYLERAMLFKVLSDKIGFPCALVRGIYGRAWVEIAVPVINFEDAGDETLRNGSSVTTDSEIRLSFKDTNETLESVKSPCESVYLEALQPEESYWFPKLRVECFKGFPNYFLKPNAIVDLVKVPGRILKLNSHEADEYRGAFLFGKN